MTLTELRARVTRNAQQAKWAPQLVSVAFKSSTDICTYFEVKVGWDCSPETNDFTVEVFALEGLRSIDVFDIYRLEKALIARGACSMSLVQQAVEEILAVCGSACSLIDARGCLDMFLNRLQGDESKLPVLESRRFFEQHCLVQQSLLDGRLYPDNIASCREVVRFVGLSGSGKKDTIDIEFITLPWLEEYFKNNNILYVRHAHIMHFFDYHWALDSGDTALQAQEIPLHHNPQAMLPASLINGAPDDCALSEAQARPRYDDVALCLHFTLQTRNDQLAAWYLALSWMHKAYADLILKEKRYPLLRKQEGGIPLFHLTQHGPLVEVPIPEVCYDFSFAACDTAQAEMLGGAWVGKDYTPEMTEDGGMVWKVEKRFEEGDEAEIMVERYFWFPALTHCRQHCAVFQEKISVINADDVPGCYESVFTRTFYLSVGG
ncbi:hypothetical protein EBZ39_05830 [bacterium]|nr:hypothetical protein [bacterium]